MRSLSSNTLSNKPHACLTTINLQFMCTTINEMSKLLPARLGACKHKKASFLFLPDMQPEHLIQDITALICTSKDCLERCNCCDIVFVDAQHNQKLRCICSQQQGKHACSHFV